MYTRNLNFLNWLIICIFESLIICSLTIPPTLNQRQQPQYSNHGSSRQNYEPEPYESNHYSNRGNRNQQRQNNDLRRNQHQPYIQGGNQQYCERTSNNRTGLHIEANKQKIWIPEDVMDKYDWKEKINENKAEKSVFIKTCCKDYKPLDLKGNIYCMPVCSNCQNGKCIAPEVCECREGFVKNDNDDCVFTCPLGCLNGKCYLDGTCQCNPGYKLDETRKFCRPICSGDCGQFERLNCTEPGICGCSKGYELTKMGCKPTCDPDCGIGGNCIDMNICDCENGFTLKDGVCQAECYQDCENGICYQRNRCICNPGFTYHERSRKCFPIEAP